MKDRIKEIINSDTIVLCIGTDKSIPDSFAPLVGSLIEDKIRLPVYGSLKHPVHALNLEETIEKIKLEHPRANILAIDAAISEFEEFGTITFKEGMGIEPGAALNKKLPKVGNNSILGIVGNEAFCFSLGRTRLSDILEMSSRLANDIIIACKENDF